MQGKPFRSHSTPQPLQIENTAHALVRLQEMFNMKGLGSSVQYQEEGSSHTGV